MGTTVKYISRRSEVMSWYWRMWRNRLWKTHLLVFIFVVIFASHSIFDGAPTTPLSLLMVVVTGLIPILGFVLFPLVKFKPQERTLSVDEEGLTTSIGQLSKSIPWAEIAEAKIAGDELIIQSRNLNAFIIPKRAFVTIEAQQNFANFVLDRVKSTGS